MESMDATEPETFIEHLKKKSCERLTGCERFTSCERFTDECQLLEEPNKDDEDIVKGLDVIKKLDLQLKEVEERLKSVTPTTSTNNTPNISIEKQSLKEAENIARFRLERKRRMKACKLKRILESLDQNQPENLTGFISRNIKLGPNSRYFSLKPEEEAIVERLLQQLDVEEDNGTVTSSLYDLGFELSKEDAQRLAEIDNILLEYQSRHDKTSLSSVSIICSVVNSPQVDDGSTTFTTHSKHARLCCKTIEGAQDKMTSVVGDYLNERRHCREYQLKSEAIDKKLRELQVSNLPQLKIEEISVLLNQCRCEQGILIDPLVCQ